MTIEGYTVDGEYFMLKDVRYLSIFCYLCSVKDIFMDVLEEQ